MNAWDLSPTTFDSGYYTELLLFNWKLIQLDSKRSFWFQSDQLIMLNTDIVNAYPINDIINSNPLGLPGSVCGVKALNGLEYGCIFPRVDANQTIIRKTFNDTTLMSTYDQINHYSNFRLHWLHDFSFSFTKMTTVGFKVIPFVGNNTNHPHKVTVLPAKSSEKLGTVYPIDLEKCPLYNNVL